MGSNFLVCRGHPLVTIEMKITDQYLISFGAVNYPVQGGPNF